MSYDVKCREIADSFLSDEPTIHTELNIARLAQVVQDAIEQEIEAIREDSIRPERERGEDDGLEYGHPADEMAERLRG